MKRRFFSALTASVMTVSAGLSAFPAALPVIAESITGETADGFTYEITDSEVIITGCTGDKETTTSLVVPESIEGKAVTTLGGDGFEDFYALTSVTLPDSITKIGGGTFRNTDISSLDLPDSLQEIGIQAFDKCPYLKELTIPQGFPINGIASGTAYGTGTMTGFQGSSIEKIILEDGIEHVPNNLAYKADNLTEVVIPDSVRIIGQSAFENADLLTDLKLPDGLIEIKKYGFYDCDSFTPSMLPDSVEIIGSYAFGECELIESFPLPSSLKEIYGSVFYNDKLLKEITIPKGVTYADGTLESSYVEKVIIEEGMETIPSRLCYRTQYVTEIVIPDSVTTFGYGLFSDAYAIKEFTVPKQITKADRAFWGSSLESISFEPGMEVIPNSICNGASNLTTVNFGSDITTIGENSFSSCKKLTSIDLPANVTAIGNYAFTESALTQLYLPDTVNDIGNSAFYNCDSLESVRLPEEDCRIGSFAFASDDALQEVTYPAGLYSNGGQDLYCIFYDCDALQKVTFAEGVTKIYESSFEDCDKLSKIVFPDTLEYIGASAFNSLPSLTALVLPSSIKTIDKYAFYGCTSLSSVNLPEGIENIYYRAFANCSSINSITIPVSLTKCESPFVGSGLAEITFAEGIEKIPDDVAYSCYNLTTAHLPASVKEFGANAFKYCYRLNNLDMPFKPGELMPYDNFADTTFGDCYALFDERVCPFDAKETFVNRIETAQGESGLINYTVYYAVNPNLMPNFKDGGYIYVSTNSTNPIAERSLPAGLRPEENPGYSNSTTFYFTGDQPTGVFRFSTEPKENADINVTVDMGVKYGERSYHFTQRIPLDNESLSSKAVSLTAPANASLRDGFAEADVYGYAPVGSPVTVYADGEAVATVEPSPYNARYKAHISVPAHEGSTLMLYAQSGEIKSEETSMTAKSKQVQVEKVILTHNNNHSGYSLDITNAFLNGTTPYIAYNPARPLAFEVTLSDNDCMAVFVSSTVGNNSSSIPLEFDESSGTWKGEGYFSTRVPGTLNINAIRNDFAYELQKTSDGMLKIGGRDFLGGENNENQRDIADDILADTKHVVTGDDTNIFAAYDFSDALNTENAGIGQYIGIHDSLTLDGVNVTAEEVAESPEKYGFVKSPMTLTDEDGTVHTYFVKFVNETDEAMSILENIPYETPESADIDLFPTKKAVTSNAMLNLFNLMADLGEYASDEAKFVNGTIVTEVSNYASGQGALNKSEFIVNMQTETSKGILNEFAKAKGYETASNYVGNTMTYLEIGTQGLGMMHELRDIINSDDPRVQAHEDELCNLAVGMTMGRATVTLAGGAAIAATIGEAAVVIAGGAAVLPEVLACVAVIGAVYATSKALEAVGGWLKGLIMGESKVASDGKMNYLIDPSGIAYEFLPSNPVEGAEASIYYQDENGSEVLWNASDYDQVNPQITDSAGWFAWDVPEGMWKVKLTAEDFADAESEWLPVMPVQTDVNIKMTSTKPGQLLSAEYSGAVVTVTFTRHMSDSTITPDSLSIVTADGSKITGNITPVKEEGNDTDCSMTYRINVGNADLSGAKAVLSASAETYAGIASEASGIELVKGAAPEYTLGDVDGNGDINSSDASAALRAYSEISTKGECSLTETQWLAADVDKNNDVNSLDASTILRYYSYVSTKEYVTFEEFLAPVR